MAHSEKVLRRQISTSFDTTFLASFKSSQKAKKIKSISDARWSTNTGIYCMKKCILEISCKNIDTEN